MSPAFTFCLIALFSLAAIGAPIAHSMIVAAVVYLAIAGQDLGLAAEQLIQGIYDSFVILAVPLFIVAANIMNQGSISDRLLDFCRAMVGRFRGGLAQVDILVSLIFSGMSGSAVADAAGVGKVTINMMLRSGHYSPGLAAAVVAASATIGPIIPPSIPMVMYALVSDASIGYLFLGGVVPGLLLTLAMMALTTWIAHKRAIPPETSVPLRELPGITVRALPALLMPVILLSGIYGGATTPTEAAAVAALYALLLAAFFYRSVSWSSLARIFSESARSSAAVGLVIGSALIFNYIVAAENIPASIARMMADLDLGPMAFLIFANVLFLALGCLLDTTTIILVIIPLFIPTCRALGIDLVHFGVVAVVNCMIGLITPPYGMLLFVINGATGIPIRDIVREVLPYIAVLVGSLALLILFPGITLWLPRLFGYDG
jgi:tripartite ATP-independent transporter DctM subunit